MKKLLRELKSDSPPQPSNNRYDNDLLSEHYWTHMMLTLSSRGSAHRLHRASTIFGHISPHLAPTSVNASVPVGGDALWLPFDVFSNRSMFDLRTTLDHPDEALSFAAISRCTWKDMDARLIIFYLMMLYSSCIRLSEFRLEADSILASCRDHLPNTLFGICSGQIVKMMREHRLRVLPASSGINVDLERAQLYFLTNPMQPGDTAVEKLPDLDWFTKHQKIHFDTRFHHVREGGLLANLNLNYLNKVKRSIPGECFSRETVISLLDLKQYELLTVWVRHGKFNFGVDLYERALILSSGASSDASAFTLLGALASRGPLKMNACRQLDECLARGIASAIVKGRDHQVISRVLKSLGYRVAGAATRNEAVNTAGAILNLWHNDRAPTDARIGILIFRRFAWIRKNVHWNVVSSALFPKETKYPFAQLFAAAGLNSRKYLLLCAELVEAARPDIALSCSLITSPLFEVITPKIKQLILDELCTGETPKEHFEELTTLWCSIATTTAEAIDGLKNIENPIYQQKCIASAMKVLSPSALLLDLLELCAVDKDQILTVLNRIPKQEVLQALARSPTSEFWLIVQSKFPDQRQLEFLAPRTFEAITSYQSSLRMEGYSAIAALMSVKEHDLIVPHFLSLSIPAFPRDLDIRTLAMCIDSVVTTMPPHIVELTVRSLLSRLQSIHLSAGNSNPAVRNLLLLCVKLPFFCRFSCLYSVLDPLRDWMNSQSSALHQIALELMYNRIRDSSDVLRKQSLMEWYIRMNKSKL